jgi:hypothetical protein
MATTEDHIINIIRYLDPEFKINDSSKALCEAKDALSHYREEKHNNQLSQVEDE